MAILFAGGEMDAFTPADGNCYEKSGTVQDTYDSSLARCAIFTAIDTTYAQSAGWGNTTDIWLHFDLYVDTTRSGEYTYFSGYDASGNEVYRLRASGSSPQTFKQYYSDGLGGFTQLGTSFTTNIDVRNTFDIHVDFSGSGGATIYLSGTERLSGTADLSGLSGIDHVRLTGGLSTYWSQVIASDESTIGKRLKTLDPTGAGSDTAWVGDYSRVDEIKYSDIDFVNSDTAAQVEMFTHSDTIPSGYVVDEVIVSARANKGTGGPQNLQLAIRSSGTNYFSSSMALDAGYEPYQAVWDQDPATTADWLNSAVTALQFGAKSIT